MENKPKKEMVDLLLNGEIKGNANNNNLLNNGTQNKNEVAVQSNGGNISGGGQVHSRITKGEKKGE